MVDQIGSNGPPVGVSVPVRESWSSSFDRSARGLVFVEGECRGVESALTGGWQSTNDSS